MKSAARLLRIGNLDRVDKLLSKRGAGSRGEVDRLLKQGRVTVDGVVIKRRSEQLPSDTKIFVDNKVYLPVPLLAVYHKPAGIVCSMRDNWSRVDLSHLREKYPFLGDMHPVVSANLYSSQCLAPYISTRVLVDVWMTAQGRLDKDTSGLLLFSRDGDLTNALLSPSSGVEREYRAIVEGEVYLADITKKLAEGE